ncbi:MAG TPA: polymer-forming cytoskeletal protein, partial [Candidatus Deferrimicrobium sp.]|nr:polymer-forming cytoskeletal protein [Candidatus Deferrimicrobium sp.]
FAGGDVVVEPSATVVSSIEARNVDIRGQVTGDVRSSQRLSLSGSGKLFGNASAARLVVEDGATLNGSISMSGAPELKNGDKPDVAGFALDSHGNGESAPEG